MRLPLPASTADTIAEHRLGSGHRNEPERDSNQQAQRRGRLYELECKPMPDRRGSRGEAAHFEMAGSRASRNFTSLNDRSLNSIKEASYTSSLQSNGSAEFDAFAERMKIKARSRSPWALQQLNRFCLLFFEVDEAVRLHKPLY